MWGEPGGTLRLLLEVRRASRPRRSPAAAGEIGAEAYAAILRLGSTRFGSCGRSCRVRSLASRGEPWFQVLRGLPLQPLYSNLLEWSGALRPGDIFRAAVARENAGARLVGLAGLPPLLAAPAGRG